MGVYAEITQEIRVRPKESHTWDAATAAANLHGIMTCGRDAVVATVSSSVIEIRTSVLYRADDGPVEVDRTGRASFKYYFTWMGKSRDFDDLRVLLLQYCEALPLQAFSVEALKGLIDIRQLREKREAAAA